MCPIPPGATPEAGHGATMSDDDDDYDSDYGAYEHNMDYNDTGGYGPLVPTETERSLMERVRQELKHELKQARVIEDMRFEIFTKYSLHAILYGAIISQRLRSLNTYFIRYIHESRKDHYLWKRRSAR